MKMKKFGGENINKKYYESKKFKHDENFIYVNKKLTKRQFNFLDNHLLLKLELININFNIDDKDIYIYRIINDKDYYNFELINNSINTIKKTKDIDYFYKVFKEFDNKYLKSLDEIEEEKRQERKDIFDKFIEIKNNLNKKIKL